VSEPIEDEVLAGCGLLECDRVAKRPDDLGGDGGDRLQHLDAR
jgi:hypothetical protein